MSHILFFDDQREWCGANWAARHLVHLILRFVPQDDCGRLVECLGHINDFPGCNVDLTNLDLHELVVLHSAVDHALAALKEAGPNTEYFNAPAFFPAFVSKFEEFDQMVSDKLRSVNENRG